MFKDILFIVAIAAFAGASFRSFQTKSLSWIQYLLLSLVLTYIGLTFSPKTGQQLALGLFLVFSILPNSLTYWNNKLVHNGKYSKAAIITSIVGVLLPLSDSFTMVKYYKGLQKLEDGDRETGEALLQAVISAKKSPSRLAELSFRSIICDFDWIVREVNEEDIKKTPQALQYKIKALGETGQLDALVQECNRHKEKFSPQGLWDNNNQSMMMLAAYCGNIHLWKIFSPRALKSLRPYFRQYWQATIDYTSTGNEEIYKESLDSLSQKVPPLYRQNFNYRLSQARIGKKAEALSPAGIETLSSFENYFQSYQHFIKDEKKQFPVITTLLLLGNIAVYFLVSTSHLPILQNHYAYGALIYPGSLLHGDWLRFLSACFVHMDWNHFAVNILAFLYFPFVEKTLGRFRFLLLYLISGVGAFLTGFLLLHNFQLVDYPTIVIGASGAISGVIGCLSIIAFKAWQSNGLSVAKRITITMFIVTIGQSIYDFFFLGASIWFHLLGFLIGLSLFVTLDVEKQDKKLFQKKLALAGISWAIFLLFALIKVPYDMHHKTPIKARTAYAAGYISEFAGEPETAVKWYLLSAEKGNVYAQAQMAYRYDEGHGIQKDPEKAVYWLLKAANQKNTWAQTNLAYRYFVGQGVYKDNKQAVYWAHQAALQGDVTSQVNLAHSYFHGTGTPVNIAESYYWYSKALMNPLINKTNYKAEISAALNTAKARLSPHELIDISARLESEHPH